MIEVHPISMRPANPGEAVGGGTCLDGIDAAAATLAARHPGLDLHDHLRRIDREEWPEGRPPWVILCLDRDHPIAGHVAAARRYRRNAPMCSYATFRGGRGANGIERRCGILYVPYRRTLRVLAERVPVLRPVWDALAHLAPHGSWIAFPDPLDGAVTEALAATDHAQWERDLSARENLLLFPDPRKDPDLLIAHELLENESFAAAKLAFSRWAERNGCATDPALRILLARISYQEGDPAEAARLLEAVWEDTGPSIEVGRLLCDEAAERGDRDRTAYLLDAMIALDDLNPDLRVARAGVAAVRGLHEAAQADWLFATECRPWRDDHWRGLGIACFRLCDFAQAQTAFEQALALRPDHPLNLNNLAMVLIETGRPGDALHLVAPLLNRPDFPSLSHVWHTHGYAHLRLGNLEAAAAAFESALRIAPDHAESRRHLDELRGRLGSAEAAS